MKKYFCILNLLVAMVGCGPSGNDNSGSPSSTPPASGAAPSGDCKGAATGKSAREIAVAANDLRVKCGLSEEAIINTLK